VTEHRCFIGNGNVTISGKELFTFWWW
jgi:hypothetical protein